MCSNMDLNRLESIQKCSVKWINKDSSSSYSSNKSLYFTCCRQFNILPVQYSFLKLFHIIVHNHSFIKLPPYLHFYEGCSRLRFTYLDHLSLVTDVIPSGTGCSASKRGFVMHISIVQFTWEELVITGSESDSEDRCD